MLLADTIYYHADGLVRLFPAGSEAPGAGWQREPHPGVAPVYERPSDPFDHDGDGRPGGSLPKRRGRPPRAAS